MSFTACFLHLCRTATLTASPAAATGYDAWRLGDGDIGKKFKFSTAVAPFIKVDQAASPVAISRIIIPGATHNLNGMRCTLSHSPDDITYTQIDQWTQGGALIISRSFASTTKRYWKLAFDNGAGGNPANPPEMAELFLTDDLVAASALPYPLSAYGDDPLFNVVLLKTPSGKASFLEKGPKAERYSLKLIMDETMATNVRAWKAVWAGKNPCPIIDFDGNVIIVWPVSWSRITRDHFNRNTCDIELEELLP